MMEVIRQLNGFNRALLSSDADKTIDILSEHIDLRKIKIPSGTQCFSWQIPQMWEVNGATLTNKKTGEVILDYKDNPFYLYVGSLPYEGVVDFEELEKHLRYKCYFDSNDDAVPYVYRYYDKDWGLSLSKNQFQKLDRTAQYAVSIDTKYSDGAMIIGEATIKGRSDDEIVIIAHTDHPFQANDNLSAVAVALEVAKELQKEDPLNHTLKALFLPETIGSIAYAWAREKELSKVKAVLALDILGNKNRLLIQRAFNERHYVNFLSEEIAKSLGIEYEMTGFREFIGSDELIFSDPKFNIPSMMISTWPYPEYHTDHDSPEIIDEEMLERSKDYVLKWVRTWDRNFIPTRQWTGPLMRSKIGWFLGRKPGDTHLELFGYKIDGRKSVVEIAEELGMDLDLALNYAHSLKEKGLLA